MLEYYSKQPHVQARIKANALYKQIRKLIYYLRHCGYQPKTIKMYIPKVVHFGIWLKDNGIAVSSVNKDTISSFLNGHLPNCRCAPPCSRNRIYVRAALNCLLCILPSQNQMPQKTTTFYSLPMMIIFGCLFSLVKKAATLRKSLDAFACSLIR